MRLTLYRFGEFELDVASREISRGGQRVALPPKSFECLVYLIEHRDRAVGRDELISAVWGRVEVSDTVVAQTLLRARKALDDTGNRQSIIRTVPRFGYQWVAPVVETDRAGDTAVADAAESASNIDATDGLHTRAAGKRPGRFKKWQLPTLLAVLAAAGLGWAAFSFWPKQESAKSAASDNVLVLPVVVSPADTEYTWVRLGAMDYIAGRLRSAGLKVLPSDQTLHLSAQVGDDTQLAKTETLQQLQKASDARWVVAPEAVHDKRGWRVRLRLYESGQSHVVEARSTTPLMAAAQANDSWLRRIGRQPAAGEHAPSPLTERAQQVDAELAAGQLAAARRLIETAPADQRNDTRLRVREGQLEYRAGRIDEATRLFEAILPERGASDDTRAKALMGLGAAEIRRRNFPAAEARYTQSLAILEATPDNQRDPNLVGNAYNGRGVARIEQGKMEEGVSDMGRARIAMQRAGDLVEAAMVDSNLGIIETKRGHYPQAIEEFDRAIAVYERFEVRDYLAATLGAKASTQLRLGQAAAALATTQRADVLMKSIEDPELTNNVGLTHTRALLANGRLRDAGQSIDRLQAAGLRKTDPALQELLLHLQSARGATSAAASLARQLPESGKPVSATLALAAIQAALRNGDLASAKDWLRRAPVVVPDLVQGSADISWELARSLIADDEGDHLRALRTAQHAAASAEGASTPETRIQAGILQARLLLDRKQPEAVAAVLGDLSTFADTDYRVAWAMLALYRALDDPAMTASALARAEKLRGERDLAIEPVL